jgi:hypothetical protein
MPQGRPIDPAPEELHPRAKHHEAITPDRKFCNKIADSLKGRGQVGVPEPHIVHLARYSCIYAPPDRFALAQIAAAAHNDDLIGMGGLDPFKDLKRIVRAAIVYKHELSGGRLDVLLKSPHRQTTGLIVAGNYNCDTEIVVWHRSG